LADEASSGFVSDIVLADYPWSPEDVNLKWEEFCSDLLSIDEQKVSDCSIYPNPTTDYINISMATTKISEIDIIDICGKTILNSKVNGQTIRMDVNNLYSGIYFVRVKTADKIFTKVFNKN